MAQKITVVWLCYFSNEEVRKFIKPLKQVKEYAPWIKNLIPIFENSKEIDLHIIAPHYWLFKTKHYENAGIKYHFIKTGMPIIGKGWPKIFNLDLWTDYFFWKRDVRKLVSKINPDIIHLHGAENEFSTTVVQFKDKYPVLITLQGFLHKIASNSKDSIVKRRINKELFIYKNFNHFAYRTETMKKVVLQFNPRANMHFYNNVQNVKLQREPDDSKTYDIVYFAKIIKSKGIEDLLKAIVFVKDEIPGLKVLIIGNSNQKYLSELKSFCIEKKIDKHITWTGFLPSQADVYKEASKAKISVLPTYYDMIPGTIIQSMFLKLPVVAYNTGSIPELNNKEKIISLVELHDINGLVNTIIKLIKNENLRLEKAEKAFIKANEIYNNSKIRGDLLKAYKTILNIDKY